MLVLSCYKFISDCKDTTFFSNFHSPFWSFFILHLQITTIFRIFAVFFSPLSSNRHIQKKRTTVCYPVNEVVGDPYYQISNTVVRVVYSTRTHSYEVHEKYTHTDICLFLFLNSNTKLPTFRLLRQTSVSKRYISICHIYPLRANSAGRSIFCYKVTTFFWNMQIFGADFCWEE